jgi:hypothetical protein
LIGLKVTTEPFDFQPYAFLGITAHPGFSINVSEGHKSDQGDHAISFFESFLDAIKSRIKCRFCAGFRDLCVLGDFFDKFSFGHGVSFV